MQVTYSERLVASGPKDGLRKGERAGGRFRYEIPLRKPEKRPIAVRPVRQCSSHHPSMRFWRAAEQRWAFGRLTGESGGDHATASLRSCTDSVPDGVAGACAGASHWHIAG